MAIVPIVKTKNNNFEIPEILHTKCAEVKTVGREAKNIAQNLLDTALAAKDPEAAGLSAPQIGINKRICLVRDFRFAGDEEITTEYILINPEITNKSRATDIKYEACLSIPNLFGQVQRAKKITVKALNLDGKQIKIKAKDFFARVIQHELDHLDGILFTDKAIGKLLTEQELEKLMQEKTNVQY
jgi:peptide deformylase